MSAIDKIRRGELFTGKRLREAIEEAHRPVLGGADILVSGSREGDVVTVARDERNRPVAFYAKLGAATLDGVNRWTYAWTEQAKTAAGYQGWTNRATGRTDVSRDVARNYSENSNAATGIQGNGVTIPDPDPNVAVTIKEVPVGRIVQMFEVTLNDGQNTKEYWFDMANPIEVVCG